ncbi:hypothetical protein RR42_s2230 [Cupriavidus basilensis]|uniref:Uncharacterized protein n=1 Tax=Cupriavidus basilensis TaxID=68895 RepID=A0A0C4YDR5_9BURK|nr:hypothetical protein RR42_s2230 [Cupriavidus basilensis]
MRRSNFHTTPYREHERAKELALKDGGDIGKGWHMSNIPSDNP